MWIVYSLLGAFFQAAGMAVKKKMLQIGGVNNFIAFFASTLSGVLMGGMFFLKTGSLWMEIGNPSAFWQGMVWLIVVNVIAVFFLFKALDTSELSYLMPYITVTSLTLIIPPMIVFNEFPSAFAFFGIAMIVSGAIVMEKKKKIEEVEDILLKKQNRKGLYYFLVTAACYTIGPTVEAVIVRESNALFASFLSYFLIGLAFIPLIFIFKETRNIGKIFSGKYKWHFFLAIFIAAIISSGQALSINTALGLQEVSYVFGLKRLMPFFAFLIGYFYFKERSNLKRKLIATAFMIAGAVLITVFK